MEHVRTHKARKRIWDALNRAWADGAPVDIEVVTDGAAMGDTGVLSIEEHDKHGEGEFTFLGDGGSVASFYASGVTSVSEWVDEDAGSDRGIFYKILIDGGA